MSAKLNFEAVGHKNVLATHKTTLEFTKEKELSLKGDCIIGVSSDFDADEVRELVKSTKRAAMTIKASGIEERIEFETNPDFDSKEEIVIRLGEFISDRTLGIRADKAAKHISREMVEKLKEGAKIEVEIEAIQ